MSNTTDYILQVKNLKKYFPYNSSLFKKNQFVYAVDDISFNLKKGETLGIVGESGCGKSTTGYSIVRLLQPTAGNIIYNGTDISTMSEKNLRPLRKEIQIIFQDPFSSLDPRMTVNDIICEPMAIHKTHNSSETQKRVFELLNIVGLSNEHASRYPHEFSGGQRQRIGIARALALNPKLIVCDEPISALDVSIQAQIVNLLQDLQKKMGLTYIFIAHDLSMVKYISDRICVMYLGKIVERGNSNELYNNPKHPYTKALLSAVPLADPDLTAKRQRIILEGSVPSPIDPEPGCRFYDRCSYKIPKCKTEEPKLKDRGGDHLSACHVI